MKKAENDPKGSERSAGRRIYSPAAIVEEDVFDRQLMFSCTKTAVGCTTCKSGKSIVLNS